jgi:PAS domain S-box-containing protein
MKQNKPTYRELKARLAEMEEALEAELRYHTVADFTYDWEYWQDQDGTLRYSSPACERITGYTVEQFTADPRLLDQLVWPQDAQVWTKHRHDAQERGLQEVRFRIRRRDGEVAWIEHVCQPVVDEQGTFLGYRASNRDITGRVQTEEALREAHRLLATIFDHTHVMVAYLDPQFNFIRVNRAYARADGREPAFFPGKNHFDLYPHAENEAIFRRVVETGQAHFEFAKPFEYAEHPERGVSYWDWVLVPIQDSDGVVEGLILTLLDVTERVQAESSLWLLSSAVEQSREGIAVSDLEGNLQFVNHAFAAMHGYTPEELAGEHLSIFHTPAQMPAVEAANRQIRETGEFQGEIWHARRDGTVFPTWMHNSLLRDAAGRPTNMIGTLHDITERIQAQEAIRQRTAQLEALHEIGLEITAQLDLEALLVSIASQAVKLLDGATGCLCLHRPERDVLERVVSIGQPVPPVGTVLRRGKGLPGRVWESGAPLIVNDRRHWDGWAPIFDKHPDAAIVGMPVKWGDEFLGVLSVSTLDNSTRTFSPADGELLRLFATQAAIAIKNAQMYERAQQDAKEKAMLLREVNHRVKNNLTGIIGLLHAAKSRVEVKDQATYQATMNELIGRVRGLATVHAMLSASQWRPLPLSELAAKVIRATLHALPNEKHVSVDVRPSPVHVTPNQAHNLALVLNELTINTVKHALGERDRVHVTFQVALDGGTARCEFRDDGPGYPQEVLKLERRGIGFNLIQGIVHNNLGGELALRNEGGAVALIEFRCAALGKVPRTYCI